MIGPTAGDPDTRPVPPSVRVLVVDDDPDARAAIRSVVGGGFPDAEIEDITDHVGFFRALQGRGFDLVICEHALHWSTGAEVLAAVKAIHPMIPVVMATSEDDPEAAAQAHRSGLDAWVVKGPGFEDRLRAALRTSLQLVDLGDRAVDLEERQRALLDRLNVGVFRSSLDGRVLDANPALLQLVGVRDLETAQQLDLDRLLGRDGIRRELLERIAADGMVRDLEMPLGESDRWVQLTLTGQTVNEGELVLDGLLEDVTENRRAEEARRVAGDQYRTVFETTAAATVMVDGDRTVALVNSAFAALTGFEREQVEGQRTWGEFVAGPDRERVLAVSPEEDRTETVEFRLLDRSAQPLDVRATVSRLPGTSRTVWSLLDLTRRLQAEAQLLHHAFHDSLTGLPNRHALLDRLDEVVDGGRPATLIVLDLDRFGVVNDGLGHRVGDRLLRAVGRRLERTISAELVACLGGDAFGILLTEGAADEALRVAAEVQLELGRPFRVAGQEVFTSASLGVADSPCASGGEELLRNAEAAMNRAKVAGRNRWVVFSPEMVEEAARAFAVENQLRRAFAADEFRVLYQPVVHLDDRRPVAFEALVRWQHPGDGLVEPGRFLPVADDAGLSVPLGRWVLGEVGRTLPGWLAVTPGLRVGVNLTLRQLLHPDLVEDLRRVVEQLVLPASSLELELGEGLMAADPDQVIEILERCAALGVRLCLDEFGSGWSSLALLHRVRFARVKLDRSLLRGEGDDPVSWRVLERVHDLARSLDLEVVVQGIEREEQLERVRAIGAVFGQGRLLGPPMEAAAATRLLG